MKLADHSFIENKFTIYIFIDLSKTFDTVNHEIMFKNLKHYGVKQVTTSYLTNRKQCITFNQTDKSSTLQIKCGVPQGSILGPLYFLYMLTT